jgi:DNA-binding CsgD family transcriptional regulator
VLNQMRAGTGAGAAPKRREEGNGATSALTARETDVLRLLSRGYTYSEVGDRLGISVHTVTSHIKNSYRKLAVRTGTAAVTRAAELGLLRQGGDKGSGAG